MTTKRALITLIVLNLVLLALDLGVLFFVTAPPGDPWGVQWGWFGLEAAVASPFAAAIGALTAMGALIGQHGAAVRGLTASRGRTWATCGSTFAAGACFGVLTAAIAGARPFWWLWLGTVAVNGVATWMLFRTEDFEKRQTRMLSESSSFHA